VIKQKNTKYDFKLFSTDVNVSTVSAVIMFSGISFLMDAAVA